MNKHIEHFPLARVQTVVNRIRLMLGLPLPALWLLAAGPLGVECMVVGAGGRCTAAVVAAHQARRLPVPCSSSFETSARCASRRAWVYSGPDGLPTFLTRADSAILCLPRIGPEPTVGEIPAWFTRAWQFCWRTALDPRAPSSVS